MPGRSVRSKPPVAGEHDRHPMPLGETLRDRYRWQTSGARSTETSADAASGGQLAGRRPPSSRRSPGRPPTRLPAGPTPSPMSERPFAGSVASRSSTARRRWRCSNRWSRPSSAFPATLRPARAGGADRSTDHDAAGLAVAVVVRGLGGVSEPPELAAHARELPVHVRVGDAELLGDLLRSCSPRPGARARGGGASAARPGPQAPRAP
jgi:hypothetical protein